MASRIVVAGAGLVVFAFGFAAARLLPTGTPATVGGDLEWSRDGQALVLTAKKPGSLYLVVTPASGESPAGSPAEGIPALVSYASGSLRIPAASNPVTVYGVRPLFECPPGSECGPCLERAGTQAGCTVPPPPLPRGSGLAFLDGRR